jgi:lysophospholipase L1-like esterase
VSSPARRRLNAVTHGPPSPSRSLLVLLLEIPLLACASKGPAPGSREFQNPSHEPRTFGSVGRALTYVVMGDSTAAGRGGDYGKGIAVSTARELARTRRVSLVNLGVSGARTRDVARVQLEAAERLRPDVVLLSVGSNDVTHWTPIRAMKAALFEIVDGLKASNRSAAIVVTGSAQIGSPPCVPWLLRPLARWRTATVNRMFKSVARERGLAFAPIAEETGPLFARDRSLFAEDRFHPNDRGYAAWIPVLNRALARALERSAQ